MKTTVYRLEFHDYFNNSDTYKNQFNYEALDIIYDYIEEYEDSTGEAVEFDIVAICCDFAESTIAEIVNDYGYMMDEEAEKTKEYIEEFLWDKTIVCGSYVDRDGETVFVFGQF